MFFESISTDKALIHKHKFFLFQNQKLTTKLFF